MIRRAVAVAALAAAAALVAARRAKPISFAGTVVFISGGSRGLGLALAFEYARRGAIPVVAARDRGEVERAVALLEAEGFEADGIAADVRSASEMRSAIDDVVRRRGRLDAVVNDAGIISVGPASVMRREDYEDALATHFWGAYNTIEAALPHLRARRGRIVNISSIGGRISVPHLLPYCVSKFALGAYSEGLRSELQPDGITVTTVYPGLMRTGSPRNARFSGNAPAEYAWFKISDTLPGLSVSARHAARAIVDACARGDATLTISLPARAAALMHGAAPGLTARILAVATRLLPQAPDESFAPRRGADVETALTRSPLTMLGETPERTLNERPAGP